MLKKRERTVVAGLAGHASCHGVGVVKGVGRFGRGAGHDDLGGVGGGEGVPEQKSASMLVVSQSLGGIQGVRQRSGKDVRVASSGQDDRAVDVRDGGDTRVVGSRSGSRARGGARGHTTGGSSVLSGAGGIVVVVVLGVAAAIAGLLSDGVRGDAEEDGAGELHLERVGFDVKD